MRPAISLPLFFLPFVSALTFTNITPNPPTSGGSITFTWTKDATDPATVTFELVNAPVLLNAIAIANNVQTSAEQLTLTLPSVQPTTGYTIVAVQIDNVNQHFGTSNAFSIAPTVTTSASSSAATVPSSTLASTASVTTPAGSSASGATTGPSSSGASSASPSSFNGNGSPGSDISTGAVKSVAAAVLGIFAGAIFI